MHWEKGKVDRTKPHFKLTYGDLNKVDPKDFIPVALVSEPDHFKFTVEFVLSGESGRDKKVLDHAVKEINFYLIELREKNPFAYARYHCGTASNIYSHIHWSFYLKE